MHEHDANKPAPVAAGRLHEKIYDQLGPLRSGLRRRLLKVVQWETPLLAEWQTRYRHPLLDEYFLLTAALGSHTAFMLLLPFLWWFGDGTYGRPLLYSLALGVYWSSWLKDALCLPRPFSPPLTRLSIGNHALEYGWPSTHSTMACSTSLTLGLLVLPSLESPLSRLLAASALLFYALSVMVGRIYSGMHSMVDCVTGAALGVICSVTVQYGLPLFDAYCWNTSSIVPLTLIPSVLAMVTFYPQPIDNCPCFEDAVCFIAVLLGIALGYHSHSHFGHRPEMVMDLFAQPTFPLLGIALARAGGRIVLGTLLVALWRHVAKKTCHTFLPPAFRAVNPVLELPRRHYRKASEYIIYSKKKTDDNAIPKELSDLPAPLESPTAVEKVNGGSLGVKQTSPLRNRGRARAASEVLAKAMTPSPIHYDIDVLTKVIVYSASSLSLSSSTCSIYEQAGIGLVASQYSVYLFPHVGLV